MFIAGFVVHITLKIPRMVTALRSMSMRDVLRTNRADTKPEPPDPDGLVSVDPAPPTMSRRGALALVGGGAVLMAVLTAGQTVGGWTRHLAVLLPRGRDNGDGPNDFPINRTASVAGITTENTGSSWRLVVRGSGAPIELDRNALLTMPQRTARLPIACVEGWSTTQTWTGVPLRDLAALAGVGRPRSARVASVERIGGFNRAVLQENQVNHPDALLALRVNGANLSLDHGFPARIIVPAMPGVLNTKWVASIDFEAG